MHDDVFQMYLDEVKQIPVCTELEEATLPALAAKGDEGARKRLLEGMLSYGLKLAAEYKDQGLPAADLVQEANIAMIMALDAYQEGDYRQQMEAMVREALKAAIEEQKTEKQIGEEMLARVNVLKDVSQVMAQELGREATVEELARKMKMTEDEIKDIMKLTLDAMSVSPDAEI